MLNTAKIAISDFQVRTPSQLRKWGTLVFLVYSFALIVKLLHFHIQGRSKQEQTVLH